MQTQIRYWDYYNLTEIFSQLHAEAKERKSFHRLYDLITSRENILLAYRTIKSNKGAMTSGTDKRTIKDIQCYSGEELVSEIKRLLLNYQPKKVKRVYIPKPNGDKRPLGIPSIMDRIIQQAFKQILEPIIEAHFYKHSYGFRPSRNTHHAIARVQYLINQTKLHFVVDIDIKGFFDNVNHTLLIKQLWNLGIKDRKVLKIISKMLKAEIDDKGNSYRVNKGTPQGGILSPLLANIVLNDLDQWVASQWEDFKPNRNYHDQSTKLRALKTSNLKEGYIVRYADDFKILCRDYKTAQKWYHAVRLYLKDRLKLEISKDKSQVTNLRKRKSDFLGFTIWAQKKGKKYVANSGIKKQKRDEIVKRARNHIKNISKSNNINSIIDYNSFVLGVHNYFRKATHVNKEFSRIAYDLQKLKRNRLKNIANYTKPLNAPPNYRKFYKGNHKTYYIMGKYLYPIGIVQTENNNQFTQRINPYTENGRKLIMKNINNQVQFELTKLMKSKFPNNSVEYFDNRLSRYSMAKGKCELTGVFLQAEEVHCHHIVPKSLGGTDKYVNLRIVHYLVHRLIHATNTKTIEKMLKILQLNNKQIEKINQYRRKCNITELVC